MNNFDPIKKSFLYLFETIKCKGETLEDFSINDIDDIDMYDMKGVIQYMYMRHIISNPFMNDHITKAYEHLMNMFQDIVNDEIIGLKQYKTQVKIDKLQKKKKCKKNINKCITVQEYNPIINPNPVVENKPVKSPVVEKDDVYTVDEHSTSTSASISDTTNTNTSTNTESKSWIPKLWSK